MIYYLIKMRKTSNIIDIILDVFQQYYMHVIIYIRDYGLLEEKFIWFLK